MLGLTRIRPEASATGLLSQPEIAHFMTCPLANEGGGGGSSPTLIQ
jgi:hypothetical protein